METVTTSVVISFGSPSAEGSGVFSAEVDSRDDGYNFGKTSFIRGDSPAVLLYASPEIVVTKILLSEGSYTELGSGSHTVEDSLTFANESSASLSKPYGGNMELVSSMPAALPTWTVSDNGILLATPVVAAMKVRYSAVFKA
jgi:hypothetical protein